MTYIFLFICLTLCCTGNDAVRHWEQGELQAGHSRPREQQGSVAAFCSPAAHHSTKPGADMAVAADPHQASYSSSQDTLFVAKQQSGLLGCRLVHMCFPVVMASTAKLHLCTSAAFRQVSCRCTACYIFKLGSIRGTCRPTIVVMLQSSTADTNGLVVYFPIVPL